MLSIDESCIGLQVSRSLGVLVQDFCSLACLKHIEFCDKRRDLRFHVGEEARSNDCKLSDLLGGPKRRSKVITHSVCEIIGWAESGSSPGACDGPYGFRPVRRLVRGREGIFGAKVASVSSLRCVYSAPHLLVVCLILGSTELRISGSVRSRLSRDKFCYLLERLHKLVSTLTRWSVSSACLRYARA